MNRTLSIPEWHQMAEQGSAPPVRILLDGNSMFPLIRWNRDYVTIVRPEGDPAVGDIVLFREPGSGRYVVHRVWKKENGMIQTWGDHCPEPDHSIPEEAVWGKVILIERGRNNIHPDPRKGIRWARFWHRAGKGYRFCHGYKIGLTRRLKKLKSWGKK